MILNVSSSCWLQRMQSHIGCICGTFLHCELSNVSSNCPPEMMHSRICFILSFDMSPQVSNISIFIATLVATIKKKLWMPTVTCYSTPHPHQPPCWPSSQPTCPPPRPWPSPVMTSFMNSPLWWRPIIFVDIIKIANDFCTPSCLDPHWPAGLLRGKQIIFYYA